MPAKPVARRAAEWDAGEYWSRFVATIYFNEEGSEVTGTVESLDHQLVGPGEYVPELLIRLDDGDLVKVVAHQVRLVNELLRTRPIVGDRIQIRYLGPAAKAAPGRQPAKEFRVRVRRPGTPPSPNRSDEPTGEVLENDKGTGGSTEMEGP